MSKKYEPYQEVIKIIDDTAKIMGLEESEYTTLKYPERELTVSLPVKMDDGTVKVFKGFRVQHSSIKGPCKGGIRYHESVEIEEVKALAAWMTFQMRGRKYTLRRSEGRNNCRSFNVVSR